MDSSRWLVVLSYVCMAFTNVISTTSSIFNHTNNTEISEKNPTVLTPDGITFSVWAPIYLFELFTVIYQCWPNANIFNKESRHILATIFLINSIWLPTFAYEYWWLSLLIISAYLWTLHELYTHKIQIDYQNKRKLKDKICAYVGVSMNTAWVTVATLLNVTIVFRNSKILYTDANNVIVGGNTDWAIACIVLASIIAIHKLFYHADIVYNITTSWALFGIYRHQSDQQHVWAEISAITLLSFSFLKILLLIKNNRNVKKDNSLLGNPVSLHS